jgi:hypothetical protein
MRTTQADGSLFHPRRKPLDPRRFHIRGSGMLVTWYEHKPSCAIFVSGHRQRCSCEAVSRAVKAMP